MVRTDWRTAGAGILATGLIVGGTVGVAGAAANPAHAHWRKTMTIRVKVANVSKPGSLDVSVEQDSHYKHGVPGRIAEMPVTTVKFQKAGTYKVTFPVNKAVRKAATHPSDAGAVDGEVQVDVTGIDAGKVSWYELSKWADTTQPPGYGWRAAFKLTRWQKLPKRS